MNENPDELQDGDNAEPDEETAVSANGRDEVHPRINLTNLIDECNKKLDHSKNMKNNLNNALDIN